MHWLPCVELTRASAARPVHRLPSSPSHRPGRTGSNGGDETGRRGRLPATRRGAATPGHPRSPRRKRARQRAREAPISEPGPHHPEGGVWMGTSGDRDSTASLGQPQSDARTRLSPRPPRDVRALRLRRHRLRESSGPVSNHRAARPRFRRCVLCVTRPEGPERPADPARPIDEVKPGPTEETRPVDEASSRLPRRGLRPPDTPAAPPSGPSARLVVVGTSGDRKSPPRWAGHRETSRHGCAPGLLETFALCGSVRLSWRWRSRSRWGPRYSADHFRLRPAVQPFWMASTTSSPCDVTAAGFSRFPSLTDAAKPLPRSFRPTTRRPGTDSS